jgi:hypothetical protein
MLNHHPHPRKRVAEVRGVVILGAMGRPRRYELSDADLNQRIDDLLEHAQRVYGEIDGADFVRQILASGVRLVSDRTARADLALLNSALKELRHSFRTFAPFAHMRKVSVFGSARTRPEHPTWTQAFRFARRIVDEGWMVITGAGSGIMGAAQGGAGREASFGVNIRLPFEQEANPTIAGDRKLINFRYFFTRKVVFVKESHAIALFPGGFGTHDEGFEALTLIQTGKSEIVPVVFVDAPGGSYWREWEDFLRSHLLANGLVSEDDFHLFRITDDVEEAVSEIQGFYANYHSSRYVDDLLVLRVQRAPDEAQLAALNEEFTDVVTRGRIAVTDPLEREEGEAADLPRVTLAFDRRSMGRLRQLIDRLNSFVEERRPTHEASPHAIVAEPIPPEARREEEDI